MSYIEEINKLIQKASKDKMISVKDISDGHHTFKELYRQRMILFSVICSMFPELSWKSKKHFDEENDPMFNGCFIVGINTPQGPATYHFKMEFWSLFEVEEIERAPKYDLYSPDEVMTRIESLKSLNGKPIQKIKKS